MHLFRQRRTSPRPRDAPLARRRASLGWRRASLDGERCLSGAETYVSEAEARIARSRARISEPERCVSWSGARISCCRAIHLDVQVARLSSEETRASVAVQRERSTTRALMGDGRASPCHGFSRVRERTSADGVAQGPLVQCVERVQRDGNRLRRLRPARAPKVPPEERLERAWSSCQPGHGTPEDIDRRRIRTHGPQVKSRGAPPAAHVPCHEIRCIAKGARALHALRRSLDARSRVPHRLAGRALFRPPIDERSYAPKEDDEKRPCGSDEREKRFLHACEPTSPSEAPTAGQPSPHQADDKPKRRGPPRRPCVGRRSHRRPRPQRSPSQRTWLHRRCSR
jgi:hypothetical protein